MIWAWLAIVFLSLSCLLMLFAISRLVKISELHGKSLENIVKWMDEVENIMKWKDE